MMTPIKLNKKERTMLRKFVEAKVTPFLRLNADKTGLADNNVKRIGRLHEFEAAGYDIKDIKNPKPDKLVNAPWQDWINPFKYFLSRVEKGYPLQAVYDEYKKDQELSQKYEGQRIDETLKKKEDEADIPAT